MEQRGDGRADSELSIVDFDEVYDDPGIGFVPADTQRGLQDTRDFFDQPCLQLRGQQTLRGDDARKRHFPSLHVGIVKTAANGPTVGWYGVEPRPVNQLRGLGRASKLYVHCGIAQLFRKLRANFIGQIFSGEHFDKNGIIPPSRGWKRVTIAFASTPFGTVSAVP